MILKEHLSGLPPVRRGFADTNGNGQSQNQLAARNHLLTPPNILQIKTVLLFSQFKQNLGVISKFQIILLSKNHYLITILQLFGSKQCC